MRSAAPRPSGARSLFRVIVPVVLVLFLGVIAWQGYVWLTSPPVQTPPPDAGDAAKAADAGEQPFIGGAGDVKIVPALRSELLNRVIDSEPLPIIQPRDLDSTKLPRDQQVRIDRQLAEFEVFQDALVNAHQTDPSAFAAVARKDLLFYQLMTKPRTNRGMVVHVQGLLGRLRKLDAPLQASLVDFRELQRKRQRAAGDVVAGFLFSQAEFPGAPEDHLNEYYEGWVFDPNYGPNPACIVFTTMPQGLSLGESLTPKVPVSFDGYFFKRYRYLSADTKPGEKGRETVLLVGNSPVVLAAPPVTVAESPFSAWASPVLTVFLALVVAAVGLLAFLHFWFRRADSRVRERLAESTAAEFVPPAPPVGGTNRLEMPGPGLADLNFDDRGGPRR
jgi:hypothetical protein